MCLFKMDVLEMGVSAIKILMSSTYTAIKTANFQALHPLLVPWLKTGSFKYQLQHLWDGWFGETDATSHLVFLVPVKRE